MSEPGLVGALRTAFQGDGSRPAPGDASTAMTGGMQGSTADTALPSAPAIDTGALGSLVSRFTGIDLSGVDRAVAGVSGSVAIQAPDLSSVTRRSASLTQITSLLQAGGATSLLDRLRAGPDGTGTDTGMDAVQTSLGQLAAVIGGPEAHGVLAAVRGVLPGGIDLGGQTGAISEALLAARDLITMVGAMMAVHTAAEDLRDASGQIDAQLAPATVAALLARAQVWAGADGVVAAVSAVTDPDDAAQVAAAVPGVAELARALGELTDRLTRAMAFGEATLLHRDPAGLVAAIDAATQQLRATDPRRIRARAELLGGALEGVLPANPPSPIASVWDAATALSTRLASAIDGLSADPIVRPVQQALGAVTGALHQINQVLGEISGAIRGAFATVRGVVSAIDVQAIAHAVTAFLQPLVDAIHELDAFLGTVMAAIGDVAAKLTAAITAVKTAIETGAGFIQGAFDAVAGGLRALELDKLIDQLRSGVQSVADALHRIQLQPYFDKAVEVMNTASDVISAVPFSLLPDSAKRELDQVIDPIEAIDFQTDVADVLEGELHAILARIDSDALGALDDAFAQVVAFLETLDPTQIIAPLDTEFDAFMTRVRAIDPEQILKPAFDAIAQIRADIAKLDLRERVLGPIERVFDQIVATIHGLDPAPLIQPIEDSVAAARQRILDVTHLDQWAGKIEDVHRAIDHALARIDPAPLGAKLDAVLDAALATVPPPADGSIVGSLIASLVGGLGLRARAGSFTAVLRWMTGDDGAAEVRAMVASADAALARAVATVKSVDLRSIAAALDAGYRRVRTAVELHPAGSALRLRLDPLLAGVAPLDTLGALGANQDGYVAALDAAASAVHAFASRGQSELTVAATGVRQAFGPLAAARGRLLALGRVVGLDLAGGDLQGVLAPLLAALRPSRILTLFGPIVAALRDKIRSILVDGLITPIQTGVGEIKQLIDQLDISVFRTELTALFTQLQSDVEAFRPSVVLAPTLSALDDFKTHLASYDPLAPVRTVIAALRAAIDDLAAHVRPSLLLHGAIDTYQQIVELAGSLNVRTLLDPVISALTDIEHQLDTGLDGAAGALGHLQASLRDLGSGGGGASASLSGGVS